MADENDAATTASGAPTAPRGMWIVGVGLLVWNLIGLAAFYMQSTMDLTLLAQSDPVTARELAAMPQWAWWVYGTATISGVAAAIALLLKRRVAFWLFVLSLLCIVIQFSRSLLMTDLVADKGLSVAIFPLVIAAIGGFQLWWTRVCDSQGQLR